MIVLAHTFEGTESRVVVEDDDRAAYAYLFSGDEVTSYVWLYNAAGPSDDACSSTSTGEAPLPRNPQMYVVQQPVPPIGQASHVAVAWEDERAGISIFGSVHAVLAPDARPGWCRLSAKPNAVARPLSELME